MAPFSGEAKSILFSTGAEAVENAVKIARAATGRTNVIAFSGAFHGRTLLALGADRQGRSLQEEVRADAGGIWHVPFPVPQFGVTVADLPARHRLSSSAPTSTLVNVAAIIIEPVQGEGGFHPAPTELLEGLRKICDQHGILLDRRRGPDQLRRVREKCSASSIPASSPT